MVEVEKSVDVTLRKFFLGVTRLEVCTQSCYVVAALTGRAC